MGEQSHIVFSLLLKYNFTCFFQWVLDMEGLRVRLLEKTVFRRIFRPEIKEVTGGWRKLCTQ